MPVGARGKLGVAARALLTVLRIRGIAVPKSARARIEGEGDLVTLERWLERAATASTIAAVFDDATRRLARVAGRPRAA